MKLWLKKNVQIFMLASMAAHLWACAPQVDSRGHLSTDRVADTIQVNQTTKDALQQQLGSPSSTSTFGTETWYYISSKKERKAFFDPKIVEQDVTRIEFDSAGIVSKVEHYTLADGKKIALVKRETPTEGHSLGVMEQLLGNLGRFNKARDRTGGSAAGGNRPY